MTELLRHPGLLLLVGALVLPWLRGVPRSATVLLLPLAALALVWTLPDGAVAQVNFLGHALTPLEGGRLGRLFATIFCLMAAGGGLFALRQPSNLEVPAAFVYAGSAVGVTLAGDLLSVFVFWELMAVGSTLVLWSAGTGASWRASQRYLLIHLFGGTLLMIGIAGHIGQTGDVTFARMQTDSVAHWFILAGFLLNAGAPPLSAWLPDAYPEASWSGMVFLSAFTTKTAVYVLLRGFPGTELLIWAGLIMVFYGIVYALLENDMRRILAYSIVNQVGFLIVGIGIGTELAVNGVAAHAFTHILYKALLLMSAGSVLLMSGRRKLSELGGLSRTMPVTAICATIGALAISSAPLTSGFISKSMLVQAAADESRLWIWLMLTAASAGSVLYVGLRFPWFVFFQKDSGLRPPEPPPSMRWAMVLFAILCIALGVWPEPLYRLLPYPVDYVPYTGAHVVTQLQLLLFSGLAFFLMLPLLKRTLTITLDVDWVYRRALPVVTVALLRAFDAARGVLNGVSRRGFDLALAGIRRHSGPQAALAQTWPIRSMALWVLVLLLAYLVLYYV